MKYLIFILTILMSVSAFSQGSSPIKTDGTKYYLQVYDGQTNEKVVYYNHAHGDWQTKLRVADFFDGSDAQLWSFEASPNFPGYFLVRNRDANVFTTFSLMSWNWVAYLAKDADRPPLNEKEKQFRFVEAFDGYYILETIEKPTDGSLYGINYTPGADALNIADGAASFKGVKSADITRANMANKVFKIVEFDPLKLFDESIQRGDNLYNSNPDAPEQVLFNLFYSLEKAREVRVFGTDGEILDYQPNIDAALAAFNQAIGLTSFISDARAFIDTSTVAEEVKASFNLVVDAAEAFINSDDLDYSAIASVQGRIAAAQDLVEAIVDAQAYDLTLVGQDARLSTGVVTSISNATQILADTESTSSDYSEAKSHLSQTQAIIDEIISANELIAATQEFEEAKAEFTAAIEVAIGIINTAGTTVPALDEALADMKEAIKAFQRALEAGDTSVELLNAGFENGLTDWNIDSPTPSAAYPENKGVDGSKSITCWKGSAYQMKVFQSIHDIPNGTYLVSCFAKVNVDNTIALFAESGGNSVVLPIVIEGGLAKRSIEIEVTDGTLQFGIKGAGVDNAIPGGNWVIFDEFEVKLSSSVAVKNADFTNNLTDWLVEGTDGAAYPENKGVDGSRSITCYRGADYNVSVSQTATELPNGTYTVSVIAKTNLDGTFVVFGESAGIVSSELINGSALAKTKTIVQVTDGMLKFGVKGAGVNNAVPAGKWVVFDNIEVVRLPDIKVDNFDFTNNLTDWLVEGTDGAAYPENKGVDGSRSITCYRGADYNVSVSQTKTGLTNGTYAVSTIAKTNLDGTFVVFGESAGVVSSELINGNVLAKTTVLASSTDGSLKFGVKGAGLNNSVPAGKWVVFDNVEVKIKSIIPVYEVFVPTPAEMLATGIENLKLVTPITYWQSSDVLNIQSADVIVKYAVYSITGVKVAYDETSRNTTLSIPLRNGVYVVSVQTENGFVDTEKIIIR